MRLGLLRWMGWVGAQGAEEEARWVPGVVPGGQLAGEGAGGHAGAGAAGRAVGNTAGAEEEEHLGVARGGLEAAVVGAGRGARSCPACRWLRLGPGAAAHVPAASAAAAA